MLTLEGVERGLDAFQTEIDFELGAVVGGVREHCQGDLSAVGFLAAFPIYFIVGGQRSSGILGRTRIT
jgi:hypothetical protein